MAMTNWAWSQKIAHPGGFGTGNIDGLSMCQFGSSYVILYDGTEHPGGTLNTNTWRWDGTAWTQLFPAANPGSIWENNPTCYDSIRGVVIMLTWVAGTWEWDGTNWAQTTLWGAANTPSSHNSDIAFDSSRGFAWCYEPTTGDTWKYTSGAGWAVALAAGTGPTGPPTLARQYYQMAYDPALDKIIFFGGIIGAGVDTQDDTWILDPAVPSWTQVTPATTPLERAKHSLIYVPEYGRCILHGGYSNVTPSAGIHTAVWSWDGTDWDLVYPTDGGRIIYSGVTPAVSTEEGATARQQQSFAYDPVNEGLLITQGIDHLVNFIGSTWLLGYTAPDPLPIRAPIAGLYIDDLRDDLAGEDMMVLNAIPEDGETGWPATDTYACLRLHIVAIQNEALATAQVWVTRSSDGAEVLAYDYTGGGFQTPYDGSESSATLQASPGSGVDDEMILVIDCTNDYTSLEIVTVRVAATTASYSLADSYSFVIEDITAPGIEEILWYTPRRCRLKFTEAMATTTTPPGTQFIVYVKGGATVTATNQITVQGLTLLDTYIGYWICIAGSAAPTNNRPRPITAVANSTGVITVDISGDHGAMVVDDGVDTDEADIIVQTRAMRLSISPFMLAARLSSEGSTDPVYSAERVQCTHITFPIAAELPATEELPADAVQSEYLYLDWEDDISYGRLYTIRMDMIEDLFDNAASNATLDFTSPTFDEWVRVDQTSGVQARPGRVGFWDDGVIPPTDRADDMGYEGKFRRIIIVLQDALNTTLYRADQLKHLDDPFRCPVEWLDHLLYNRGNPFTFPLETTLIKRKLAAALPGFYKRRGTAIGITDMLFVLLGIEFTITPYATGDFWILGTDLLNTGTILGPGDEYVRNSYEIDSPVDLTTTQRRIVVDVAQWADPLCMHLARLVEPSSGAIGADISLWVLGTSILGTDTTFA